MKKRLNCLTTVHLSVQGGGTEPWEGGLGSPGVLAAGTIPKSQAGNSPGLYPVGGQEHLQSTSSPSASARATTAVCVCVAPTLLAWGWIAGNYSWELLLLLLLTLASGYPSPAWGLSVFFCSPFRVVSTLFPSRNQSAASFRNCGQHLKNQRRMETLWKITKMGVRLH